MAAYYHNNHENSTPQISDHANLHTLILMNNPNSYGHDHQQQQQQQQQQQLSSNNILLLNSAAAAASYSQPPPPFPHHQFVRDNNNNITLYGYPQEEARDISRARQGLSLTLSSQNQGVAQGEVGGGDGGSGGQVSVLGSKYLRAAQELLEEVVNVGDTLTITTTTTTTTTRNNTDDHSPKKGKGVGGETPSDERDNHGNGGGGSGSVQLTTSERQEIQMKKAKLVTMLDEAEQRYRQYNNQMQIVIESFERAAGMGSAKTYTALALKTISKQFRCLKDAIQGQIRAANKSLGEDEGGTGSLAGKIEGSRLKFIDHQIRQQRALQQLGMIQNHNAWRPQRGLPERSVSVLRAWLFEHFLHPYPKDSDKILLAKQTGLTRSQVSNWFINARVRLWKPMIEEMYNEELKEQEQNGSDDKTSSKENSNDDDAIAASNSITEQEKMSVIAAETQAAKDAVSNSCSSFMSIPTTSATPYKGNGITIPTHHNQGFLEMEGISQGSPKRQRSNNDVLNNGEIMIKFGNEKEERENGYPIISGGMNFIGGGGELGSYGNMGDLGRFETEDFHATRFLQGNGNGGISLSLGLPPSCENHHQQFNNLSAATNNHTFISPNHQNIHHHQFRRGNDFGSISSPSSQHSSAAAAAAFECIDIQNRKGFAARLLPDFVA